MRSPYLPIPEMLDLLKQKNFTEQQLGLQSKPGMIDRKIREAITLAVEASLEKSNPQNILLEIKATDRTQDDQIKFTFRFDYNLEQHTLRIRELTTALNERDVLAHHQTKTIADARKLYVYNDSRQLIDAKEASQLLYSIRIQKQHAQTYQLQPTYSSQKTAHL